MKPWAAKNGVFFFERLIIRAFQTVDQVSWVLHDLWVKRLRTPSAENLRYSSGVRLAACSRHRIQVEARVSSRSPSSVMVSDQRPASYGSDHGKLSWETR